MRPRRRAIPDGPDGAASLAIMTAGRADAQDSAEQFVSRRQIPSISLARRIGKNTPAERTPNQSSPACGSTLPKSTRS